MVSIHNALTPAEGKFILIRGVLGLWHIMRALGSGTSLRPFIGYKSIFFSLPYNLLIAFTFQ